MTPVSSPTPDEQAAEGYESGPEIYTHPKLEYDVAVDAGYVKIQAGTVARTFAGPHGVNLDFDADGNLLGVELLGFTAKPEPLSSRIMREQLQQWEDRHGEPPQITIADPDPDPQVPTIRLRPVDEAEDRYDVIDLDESAPEALAPFGCGHCSDRAALVVVREQLTQAQAENRRLREMWDRSGKNDLLARIAAVAALALEAHGPGCYECTFDLPCDFKAALSSPPTYTTEGPTPPS